VLTLFAFSEENWQRPPTEISALMSLLEEYIAGEAAELRDQGVSARAGERAAARARRARRDRPGGADTRGGGRLALNLCISYSSRPSWRARRACSPRKS